VFEENRWRYCDPPLIRQRLLPRCRVKTRFLNLKDRPNDIILPRPPPAFAERRSRYHTESRSVHPVERRARVGVLLPA